MSLARTTVFSDWAAPRYPLASPGAGRHGYSSFLCWTRRLLLERGCYDQFLSAFWADAAHVAREVMPAVHAKPFTATESTATTGGTDEGDDRVDGGQGDGRPHRNVDPCEPDVLHRDGRRGVERAEVSIHPPAPRDLHAASPHRHRRTRDRPQRHQAIIPETSVGWAGPGCGATEAGNPEDLVRAVDLRAGQADDTSLRHPERRPARDKP